MTRGRKSKPTHLKVVAGTDRKARINEKEPDYAVPDSLNPPPELDNYAAEKWAELAPLLHDAGVLKVTDLDCLAAFCCAYSRWRRAEELVDSHGLVVPAANGSLQKNPAVTVINEALRQMAVFGSSRARFGLSSYCHTLKANGHLSATYVPIPHGTR